MIVICAWCKADQGTKEPLDNQRISHGICSQCLEEMSKDIQPLHNLMDEEFFEVLYSELVPQKKGLTQLC